MDFERPVVDFPPEKELEIYKIRDKIKNLSREELEAVFVEASGLLMRLTLQSNTLLDYIHELEGKLSLVQD